LQSGTPRYELSERQIANIPRLLAEGKMCISGWCQDELVFYGWLQFKYRQLIGSTLVSLPQGSAFIYRCFTREEYRGNKIYPAALCYAEHWLAEHGHHTVFIDHVADNTASQRAILAVGMQPIGQYRLIKILDWRWARYGDDLRRGWGVYTPNAGHHLA